MVCAKANTETAPPRTPRSPKESKANFEVFQFIEVENFRSRESHGVVIRRACVRGNCFSWCALCSWWSKPCVLSGAVSSRGCSPAIRLQCHSSRSYSPATSLRRSILPTGDFGISRTKTYSRGRLKLSNSDDLQNSSSACASTADFRLTKATTF